MNHGATMRWVRVGLVGLPIYGLLTLVSTWTHQPDPTADFPAYSRYVTTDFYLATHLVGSILGSVLAILAAVALGIYLAGSSQPRLALWATVANVSGLAFVIAIFGMSTFATPAIGAAHLDGVAGMPALNEAVIGWPVMVTALLGGLLYSTATILFGIAIWRSGTLPKWAGIALAPTGLLISIVGLMIGGAQTVGAVLTIVAGVWIVAVVFRARVPRFTDPAVQCVPHSA